MGAGASGRGCTGVVTRCDRSLIADWRADRAWWGGGVWGSGRFAICEKRLWSCSFSGLFSAARNVSFWVTPESRGETVSSPLTRWVDFVTGRGGEGFHSPGPAFTTGWGSYYRGDPRPAAIRGESPLIPWTGPRFSPPLLTGTRLRNGWGRRQG